MDVLHDVRPYDGMEIRLHEIEDEVDVFIIFCLEDVNKTDDVRVTVELLKEDNLN